MIILIIVFFALDRVHLSDALEKEKVHFGTKLENKNDGTDAFYPFEWMVKVSIKQCVDACIFTKACEYINYEIRDHTCALIRIKKALMTEENAVVIDKQGYVFGNKSEWSMDKVSKCDNCVDYGQCSSDTLCRNSGCKLTAGVVHGNMLTTGGKIIRKIKADPIVSQKRSLETFSCSDDGIWISDHSIVNEENGVTYYIQTVPMSWFDAKEYCESLFGHLADINTSEEQKVITNALIGSYRTTTWIGGNDIEVEGTFRWSDGSDISGYNNWEPSLNDDRYGEDCMTIHVDTSDNFYWNALDCEHELQCVCEFHQN